MKRYISEEKNRLDTFLSISMEEARNQVAKLIKTKGVKVNGELTKKPSFALCSGDLVEVEPVSMEKKKESKKLDVSIEIIYEDEDILVINKPPHVVVHPAPSVKEATLVDWLVEQKISLSTLSGEERHGIVHRIDKQTSGALVIAKNNQAHQDLSNQLQDKSMGRYYLALTNLALKENLLIDRPIARNPQNRLKMAVVANGREAKSAFCNLDTSPQASLIGAKLFTGRTHQIRVHLASISRHILGDDLYGFKSQKDTISRVMLHAFILYLKHPRSNELLSFKAPLFDDFKLLCDKYFQRKEDDEIFSKDYLPKLFSSCDSWMCLGI